MKAVILFLMLSANSFAMQVCGTAYTEDGRVYIDGGPGYGASEFFVPAHAQVAAFDFYKSKPKGKSVCLQGRYVEAGDRNLFIAMSRTR